jgi:hypothetical protein
MLPTQVTLVAVGPRDGLQNALAAPQSNERGLGRFILYGRTV